MCDTVVILHQYVFAVLKFRQRLKQFFAVETDASGGGKTFLFTNFNPLLNPFFQCLQCAARFFRIRDGFILRHDIHDFCVFFRQISDFSDKIFRPYQQFFPERKRSFFTDPYAVFQFFRKRFCRINIFFVMPQMFFRSQNSRQQIMSFLSIFHLF